MSSEIRSDPRLVKFDRGEHLIPWQQAEPFTDIPGVSDRFIGWMLSRWRRRLDSKWEQEVAERIELARNVCQLWRESVWDAFEEKYGKNQAEEEVAIGMVAIAREIICVPDGQEQWKIWVGQRT